MAIHVTPTHRGAVRREVIRNKTVRIARSLGIARDGVIDIAHQGRPDPNRNDPPPQHAPCNAPPGRQQAE
ncbi:hypothetical protein P279_16355 [Rhodobacteraceae bacterium PD-2]|nr:hypothetical protein P279_16355 [Rhodobacteraceae bacterium PD-2]